MESESATDNACYWLLLSLSSSSKLEFMASWQERAAVTGFITGEAVGVILRLKGGFSTSIELMIVFWAAAFKFFVASSDGLACEDDWTMFKRDVYWD